MNFMSLTISERKGERGFNILLLDLGATDNLMDPVINFIVTR